MQSRDRIAYLAALSLFMSAVELLIPRPLPFFRLGIANVPLLMALCMDFRSYMLLALLKGIGTSYVSGNLFSVFAIISIMQAAAAGMAMHALSRILGRHASLYGISCIGAGTSVFVQIALASLYIGKGTMVFLPLMLLLSLPSSAITAAIASRLRVPDPIPIADGDGTPSGKAAAASMLISGMAVMMMKSAPAAILALAASLIFQSSRKRRIMVLPHFILLLFMILSSVPTPSGAVLFRISSVPVTEGAIIRGLQKSLQLSAGIALSQGFSTMIRPGRGIAGRTLAIFSALLSSFRNTEGGIVERIRETLEMECIISTPISDDNIPVFTIIALPVYFIVILVLDYCIF